MWEAIQSNRRRSLVLISAMGALLVVLGAAIGAAMGPAFGGEPDATAAALGAAVALSIWLVLLLTATAGGDSILLLSTGARQIHTKAEFPRLWNVVEEMTIASGLGTMPQVHVVEDDRPNAFAVGIRRERAAVAVTSGLLRRLNRDELQGVVAHEIGHIMNRDVRFMVLAGVMVGSIVILTDLFLRLLFYGGMGRRRSSGKGGDGRIQVAIIAAAVLLAILAPLFARLLYFACSRRREYLADASAAQFTRYPAGLASALGKIAGSARPKGRGRKGGKNRTMAPMYIINPLQAHGAAGMFSTHPPTEKRIQVLQTMAGAEYGAYETAYRKVFGKDRHCLGEVTLADGRSPMVIREATPEPEAKKSAETRGREIADFLDRVGGWAAFGCACGVGIKVPPDFTGDIIPCPRCGRDNPVPKATPSEESKAGEKPLEYRRRGDGWESFRCRCGKTVQLSPAHVAPSVVCGKCRRKIRVHS